MKRAIIFDLDGVIVDSESHWREVSHEFLRELIPAWSEEDQRQIWGMSATAVFDRLTGEYGLKLSWEEYLANYERLAVDIYGRRSQPVPGVLELISFLSQAGYDVGLASSAPRAWVEMVLERFFLKDRFAVVVTAEDVGNLSKPAPEPYLLAAARMGRRPEECIAIEDSPKGIKSAKAAGMACIAIGLGHNRERDLSEADLVIGSFDVIPVRTFDSWLRERVALPKPPFSS